MFLPQLPHTFKIQFFYFFLYVNLRSSRRVLYFFHLRNRDIAGKELRGLLEKYPTFGREKETGFLGALDT